MIMILIVSIPFDQGNVFRLRVLCIRVEKGQVSIPFDQGNVFRHTISSLFSTVSDVSIPFDQGNVFRHIEGAQAKLNSSLNPFRSGQCLSTIKNSERWKYNIGLNPFRSGQCLSTKDMVVNLTAQ